MQKRESIDEIMDRLWRGETLMIDDQMRSYISIEDDDTPMRFVIRSVLASLEDASIIEAGEPGCVKYEEQRFGSLAEVLLSLTDYKWISK